jgi:CheY-like chemotaxis protein
MPKKWVLVVDDDPEILAAIEKALEHPLLTVTTAADALQAFIQARSILPVLIVSDIMMPKFGDGTTILKRLREDPRVPPVPIIFMTGMPLDEARRLLPENDATISLIGKPIDLKKLRDDVWARADVAGKLTKHK